MEENLAEVTAYVLRRLNFKVSNGFCKKSSCISLAARQDRLLMVKTSVSVDDLKAEQVDDLKKLARFFKASPIIVGENRKHDKLENGIVYERYGVPTITLRTLLRIISGKNVYVYAYKGGYYVFLDGERLRNARLEKGWSRGELASRIGVSRRAIYEYEREKMGSRLEVAVEIERKLKADLVKPLDIFDWNWDNGESNTNKGPQFRSILEMKVYKKFIEMGFHVEKIDRAPFQMVGEYNEHRIISRVNRGRLQENVIKAIKSFADVVEAKPMIVSEHKESFNELTVLTPGELDQVKSPQEILEL